LAFETAVERVRVGEEVARRGRGGARGAPVAARSGRPRRLRAPARNRSNVTSFEAGSFLARLTAADLSALERVGTVVRYEKGREIFAEGADSDHVVALTAGRVKITSIDADGRESLLAVRAPGDLLGELSAIDKLPRSANA